MKTEVMHEDNWWSYIETCDRCGKTVLDHAWKCSAKPDTNEADFCVDCYRYLLDNHVPYEVAKKQYRHN